MGRHRVAPLQRRGELNSDTLLYRQAHPNWIRDDFPTSQAFTPTPKDELRLSAYDGDGVSASSSWEHYTSQGLLSSGVAAVTLEECEWLGLNVILDPLPDSPHHVLIDFSGLSSGQRKRRAQRLTDMAEARGWLFRPEDS